MSKILIDLYVPSLQVNYDMFVPDNLEIRELIMLIVSGLKNLSIGNYQTSEQEILCLLSPDKALHPGNTLRAYGIKDGDRLILF